MLYGISNYNPDDKQKEQKEVQLEELSARIVDDESEITDSESVLAGLRVSVDVTCIQC